MRRLRRLSMVCLGCDAVTTRRPKIPLPSLCKRGLEGDFERARCDRRIEGGCLQRTGTRVSQRECRESPLAPLWKRGEAFFERPVQTGYFPLCKRGIEGDFKPALCKRGIEGDFKPALCKRGIEGDFKPALFKSGTEGDFQLATGKSGLRRSNR
jgi:hypothetical protein